ncbi:MAG: TonB-dependent receptor [Odoribacteraceae bacterium]|jgi:iron complex outermembrane receptor protein|nr:TonB-dependent receptor [Odoribacteraceae bacterium]
MKTRLFLLVTFTFVALSPARARVDTLRLGEVVVTGTRTNVHRDNMPATISVVSRQEIEESGETSLLPVLSGRVPGLFVTERGVAGFGVSSGSAGSITLRGVGGGTGVLVLIDGHPQYMGIMGHHMPDAYMSSDVERVEVIRGPASLLYGSNAMGGAINIITRSAGNRGWHGDARYAAGSAYNTLELQAGAGYRGDGRELFFSLNHDRTDGHRDNKSARFKITNGYVKTGVQLSKQLRATADASIAVYETSHPGPVTSPVLDNTATILRGVVSATLENQSRRMHGALAFFYNFGDHEVDDGHAEGAPETLFLFRSRDHNYGFQLYQTFLPFHGNAITAGVDFKNLGGNARDDYKDGVTPDKIHIDTSLHEAAGYLVVQQTLRDKLTLNAGLRLEYHERFGREWVPQAGVAYRPFRDGFFKFSVAKGFRAPVLRDLFYRAEWAGANPDLKPETMVNHELSAGQAFFNGRLSVEASGFVARGKNMIVTNRANWPPVTLNAGRFKYSGVELSARWSPVQGLRVDGNYSYLHAKTPVTYAPGQQVKLLASYRLSRWNFGVNYHHASDIYSTAVTREHFNTLDARVAFRLFPRLLVFVRGENLTDASYEIMEGYPMPGVTATCGIHFDF